MRAKVKIKMKCGLYVSNGTGAAHILHCEECTKAANKWWEKYDLKNLHEYSVRWVPDGKSFDECRWNEGRRETLYGNDIYDALERAGYDRHGAWERINSFCEVIRSFGGTTEHLLEREEVA